MRLKALLFSVVLASLPALNATAAPTAQGDDIEKLLAEKGLMSQLEQVRQTVGS